MNLRKIKKWKQILLFVDSDDFVDGKSRKKEEKTKRLLKNYKEKKCEFYCVIKKWYKSQEFINNNYNSKYENHEMKRDLPIRSWKNL